MARIIEFVESFDVNPSTFLTRKWSSGSVNGFDVAGRHGNAARFDFALGDANLEKDLPDMATRMCSFAIYITTHSGSTTNAILKIQDGSTIHLYLRLDATRHVQILRGDNTVLGTSTTALSLTTWYSIQVKVTIHDTTGAYNVLINSSSEISGTNADTRNGGNSTCNRLRFTQTDGSSFQFRLDDVVIASDTDTNPANNLLGDLKVNKIQASGNGSTNDWTVTGAASNWQAVSEAGSDDDSTYVSTTGVGNTDLYNFTNTTIGDVKAIAVNLTHRKDDSGPRTLKAVYRNGSGGTTTEQGSSFPCSETYSIHQLILETDPATSLAWSQSGLDDAQFGVRLNS